MQRTAIVVALLAAHTVHADVVHATQGPFGGWFGLWGPTVSDAQIVGTRFVPTQNYTLTSLHLWFMNDSPVAGAPLRITLRTDGTHADGSSIPSSTVIESWDIGCLASGWAPLEHAMNSTGGVALRAGVRYWVVAESDAPSGFSPVWNFAASGLGWNSLGQRTPSGEGWQGGGSGAALTLTVIGTPGLPPAGPDLDGNGRVDGYDLGLLLGAWGPCSGACVPDLDHDGTVGGSDLGLLLGAWTG